MKHREIEIAGRRIGPGHPTYFVAELSANHNQNYEDAVRLIRAAKAAGADAVKVQTYTPDTITIDCDSEHFVHDTGSLWEGRSLYELYQEAYTPWEWQPDLQREAEAIGLTFFSTPFDPTAVSFLEEMNVPAYKVASFEVIDIPLLKLIARTGKPVIMSTGMASLEEISEAVATLRDSGVTQLALLKCTSAYPAPPESMNLRTIPYLAETFDVAVGLSDHTLEHTVPVASAALGASVIEKHFTLSRSTPGPDSAFSLEPEEFKSMIEAVRVAEKATGGVHFGGSKDEAGSRKFRRSLFVVSELRAGEEITEEHVRSIRPGHGLPPKHLTEVLGRVASEDIPRGSPLQWRHVA